MLEIYIPRFLVCLWFNLIDVYFSFLGYSVKDELVHAIDAEIKAEKQLEQDNLGGSSPPTIQGFAIKKNEAEVTLSKTFGNEKLFLSIFNVKI